MTTLASIARQVYNQWLRGDLDPALMRALYVVLNEQPPVTATEAQIAPDTEAVLRRAFEHSLWAYYQNLKKHGWSSPHEGDTTNPQALFWRESSGKYVVLQVEAAWGGYKLAVRTLVMGPSV